MKKWIILNKLKTQNSKLKANEVIKILLENRGLTEKKDIDEFLYPSFDRLNLNNLQINRKELDKAVKRIQQAIKNKESIVVYTDYDVDGICSGALVWETLYGLGAKVMPYVPNRLEEGYGLSIKGIDYIKKIYNASLIITVDHGVSGGKKIDYAGGLGIDTIIIDHHVLPTTISNAVVALIHTTELCAGGVAWIFCNYFKSVNPSQTRSHKRLDNTQDLDLVALATIADLIPLVGPNRALVFHGLQQLNKTKRIGLNALFEESGLEKGRIGAYEVGHILAPRINAMGRLMHAFDVLRLFCTKDYKRAKDLAKILDSANRERQMKMNENILHAITSVKKQLVLGPNTYTYKSKLIFIADENYHQGVIGLVAGKLVEEFYLPAIVISKGKDYSKASARSINGFNIVEAIRKATDLLEDVGGHPMAAGFTVKTQNIAKLEKRLTEIVQQELVGEKLEQVIKIDLEIDLSDITDELYNNISKLSPFGVGNPQPVFVSHNVKVIGVVLVGKEKKHLKLTIKKGTISDEVFVAIGFNMAKLFDRISFDKFLDIVYTIEENNWNFRRSLQLKLKDVKVLD